MKTFKISLILLLGLNGFLFWNTLHRDKSGVPPKSGIVLEKREIPTRYGYEKTFHIYWKTHPKTPNQHEDVHVSDDLYYTSKVGEIVQLQAYDYEYPAYHQKLFNVVVLVFSLIGLGFTYLEAKNNKVK